MQGLSWQPSQVAMRIADPAAGSEDNEALVFQSLSHRRDPAQEVGA